MPGVHERAEKLVRDPVLDDAAPFVPLVKTKRGRQGEFWHSLIDESFGSSVRICPIYIDWRFILWRPREAGGGARRTAGSIVDVVKTICDEIDWASYS